MPARSIASGAYLVLMYLESSSNAADWYRVALDRRTRALSCDCAQYTFNQRGDRTCKHTDFVQGLLITGPVASQGGSATHFAPAMGAQAVSTISAFGDDAHPYVQAINAQFPGFRGHWRVAERRGYLAPNDAYRVVQIGFQSGNGDTIDASLAFAERHGFSPQQRLAEIAVRAGYCLALELAHRHGIDLDVRPPSHYNVRGPSRGATLGTPRRAERELPSIQLDHILRVAGAPAAGNTPAERAEGTLRLMLGDETYSRLLRDGYLDVQSLRHVDRRRMYRLRRDPNRREDKRVRVFEEVGGHMTYVKDFCIVRASSSVPEPDMYLSKWLGLLSDEDAIIGVVGPHNIFSPHSDDYAGRIEERRLPIWREPQPATAA